MKFAVFLTKLTSCRNDYDRIDYLRDHLKKVTEAPTQKEVYTLMDGFHEYGSRYASLEIVYAFPWRVTAYQLCEMMTLVGSTDRIPTLGLLIPKLTDKFGAQELLWLLGILEQAQYLPKGLLMVAPVLNPLSSEEEKRLCQVIPYSPLEKLRTLAGGFCPVLEEKKEEL